MKTLIISDAHLNAEEDGRKTREEFALFLGQIHYAHYQRIIVLGDLFDFWFEYRHVIFSGYFEVLRAFAALRDQGVELHLICGNHDFWAGRFLRDELGFIIHPDTFRSEAEGRRVLFVHGDGINLEDLRYRLYKRMARSWISVKLFGCLHPDWAMAIALRVSRVSRALFAVDDPEQGREVKPLQRFAKMALAKGEADVVCCGHSHYPVREEYPTPKGMGLYINTGDWMRHKSYVEWEGTSFELKYYDFEEWETRHRLAASKVKENEPLVAEKVPGEETAHAEQNRD